MKKRYEFLPKNWLRAGLFTVAISAFPYLGLQAQNIPSKMWDKTFGGAGSDAIAVVKPTSDGGFIMGGRSDSGISGDKTQASKGASDFWLVKTDVTGTKTWDKTYGGNDDENFRVLLQTSDGGYLIGGYSKSGLSGDKSQATKGDYDFWIVKLDASGNKTWDKTFGGSSEEKLFTAQQTADGGYILGGASTSGATGDKTQASKGLGDFWVVKLDATGTKTWDKSFGGSGLDELHTLQQTADGGYILGGNSASPISGDKTQASKGGTDYWVVKIDATGTKTWDKTLGGSGEDVVLFSIQQTVSGGYILGGSSASGISGDKTEASKGGNDYWVLNLDATGTKTWDKTLGGSAADNLRSIQQTTDGGYVMGGTSASPISGDKTQALAGTSDFWIVKLDATGTKTWDKTLGGSGAESFNSMRQTTDGGYIVGGGSDGPINGDKSQASKGGNDFWVIKLTSGAPAGANDVGVNAIPGLASGCVRTSAETISVTVENKGTAPQSNIPVSYKISTGTNPGAWVNEVIQGPLAPNTSITYPFIAKANLSTAGSYTIRAKTTLSGDVLAANDSLKQTITLGTAPAAATITSGGSTTICTGGTVTLTASTATTGVTYQWFKDGVAISNATAASYIANAAGSYTVTALSLGCAGPASAATAVTMNTPPIAPAVSANGPLAICLNGSVTFTAASVAGASFTWFKNGTVITGASGNTYTATTAGSYTATASLNGCGSPASTASVVTIKTTPSTPSITRSGATLTSSSTANNQWYLNGVLIPGATNRTLLVNSNGSYTVIVTSNGCSSAASAAVVITNLSVNDELNTIKTTISPNPSTGMFQVELPKAQAYEMEVTDLTGKVILSQKSSDAKTVLDLNGKAKGVYLLKLVSEGKTATRKLVIE